MIKLRCIETLGEDNLLTVGKTYMASERTEIVRGVKCYSLVGDDGEVQNLFSARCFEVVHEYVYVVIGFENNLQDSSESYAHCIGVFKDVDAAIKHIEVKIKEEKEVSEENNHQFEDGKYIDNWTKLPVHTLTISSMDETLVEMEIKIIKMEIQ